MAADQIVQRRGGATISNQTGLDPGPRREEQACHVRGRADAAVRLLHAVAVLLQIGHEFTQILGREVLPCHDHRGRVRRETDRHEIPHGIVFQVRSEHRRGDMRAHAAGKQRIAVGVRLRHTRAADRAAGAADILDHHGLPENSCHLVRHDARDDVARTARGKRHDHGDRARRINLRLPNRRDGTENRRCETEQPPQHHCTHYTILRHRITRFDP